MNKNIADLNELLARSLGRTPYGEGIFEWRFSEDLFWPEFPTGQMVSKRIAIPLIGSAECPICRGEKAVSGEHENGTFFTRCERCEGSGIITEDYTEISVPEYRREKMAPNLDKQWVMTIWMKAEELPQWQSMFPGAPYPARGTRIHTNASLPSYPGGPTTPNLEDTERFIKLMRFQRSHTLKEAEIGIDDERKANDAAVQKEIEDEIRDSFPAFMNLEPGKRGGWVSTPYSKKDLQ